jgi:alkylated DNA nucleotide flippase Atl1
MSGLDYRRAEVFTTAIPEGRWASYGDVADAAGSPKAYMTIWT